MARDRDSTSGGARTPTRRTATVAAVGAPAGLIVGLAIGALVLGAGEPAGSTARSTTLEQIRQEPREFLGEPAVVSGVVREILSPRAFTIADRARGVSSCWS